MDNFIPELLLSTYASILDGKRALYCSMPITSGRRFLDWLAKHRITAADVDSTKQALREDHRQSVIIPNREHAQQVVHAIRTRNNEVVIDPSALPHIPNWTQHVWRSFWEHVIERFAQAVYFVDDWAYSNGCAYEFYVAHRLGLPVYDEHSNLLDLTTGKEKIVAAAADFEKRNHPADFHVEILELIDTLSVTSTEA